MERQTSVEMPMYLLHSAFEIRSLSQDCVSVVQIPNRLATIPTTLASCSSQGAAISGSRFFAVMARIRYSTTGRSMNRMTIEIHQMTVMVAWETLYASCEK